MASIQFTLIIIVALVGIMSLDKVQGLKCFHCGESEGKCAKDNPGVSKECPGEDLKYACWKVSTDGEVIKRACGPVAYTGCEGNDKDKICICTSPDNCNGDSGSSSGSDGKAGSGSDGKAGSGSDGKSGAGYLCGWTTVQILIVSIIAFGVTPRLSFIGSQ